jgi:hypothetical protein
MSYHCNLSMLISFNHSQLPVYETLLYYNFPGYQLHRHPRTGENSLRKRELQPEDMLH